MSKILQPERLIFFYQHSALILEEIPLKQTGGLLVEIVMSIMIAKHYYSLDAPSHVCRSDWQEICLAHYLLNFIE